jgi:hypothetical protein
MIRNPSTLFSPPLGPLGSFSARIELCYALGLSPKQVRRDLILIRKIRNDFAHQAKTLTFDDPGIADRCAELFYSMLGAPARPRPKFTNAVMAICAVLHHSIEFATHQSVPSTEERLFSEGDMKAVAAFLKDFESDFMVTKDIKHAFQERTKKARALLLKHFLKVPGSGRSDA